MGLFQEGDAPTSQFLNPTPPLRPELVPALVRPLSSRFSNRVRTCADETIVVAISVHPPSCSLFKSMSVQLGEGAIGDAMYLLVETLNLRSSLILHTDNFFVRSDA
ncbi:hypothetical protein BLNAU_21189 [Blattamonas nauphoetae]|uniref:Uncharacterized protein n=1 Tax=Blattamonas nauphoetae TaxID=2049346 RepID=A0ABQ9WZR6_9EUKA|nr:hypothetical protein BLNAU_21189 [Blattamonas nauphoetae]